MSDSDVQVSFARDAVSSALATYAADHRPAHELTCLHFCQMAPSVSSACNTDTASVVYSACLGAQIIPFFL